MRRPVLASAIVMLSLGAGLLSLAALRWIGFLGLPPVFFLTLLLVGMPVGGLLLVRIRWLRDRPLSGIVLISVCLSVAGGILFLLALVPIWEAARVVVRSRRGAADRSSTASP